MEPDIDVLVVHAFNEDDELLDIKELYEFKVQQSTVDEHYKNSPELQEWVTTLRENFEKLKFGQSEEVITQFEQYMKNNIVLDYLAALFDGEIENAPDWVAESNIRPLQLFDQVKVNDQFYVLTELGWLSKSKFCSLIGGDMNK